MKTSKLTGTALDWAVAQCEGEEVKLIKGQLETLWTDNGWKPSTDWAQGGAIIEREGLGIWKYQWNEQSDPEVGWWYAEDKNGDHVHTGTTPLIAAMRCLVASKLGEEVALPEELK